MRKAKHFHSFFKNYLLINLICCNQGNITFTYIHYRYYFYYRLIIINPIVKDIVKKYFISKLHEFLYKHMR